MSVWAEAVVSRLAFLGQEVTSRAPALRPFLHACLDFLEAAAVRPDLAPVRAALPGMCALARAAIDGDCDDRTVNAVAARCATYPGRQAGRLSCQGGRCFSPPW